MTAEQQRPSPPALEGPAPRAGRRPLRPARDGLPLPDGGVEVESGGAPALRPGVHQLVGQAVAEPGVDARLGAWDGRRRGRVDGEPGPGGLPDEGEGARRRDEAAGPKAALGPLGLGLHHQPTATAIAELTGGKRNIFLNGFVERSSHQSGS